MNQDPVIALARRTPIDALATAWGCTDKEVGPRLEGREPMTVRDLGVLADIHGVDALLDALDSSVHEIARRNTEGI